MQLQELLPSLEKDYLIFEQDGRVRQPLLQFASVRAYEHSNPGVFWDYFLHREIVNGQTRFTRICQHNAEKYDAFYYDQFPIARIELIDDRPHAMELVPWEVLIVRVFSGQDLVKGKPALVRIVPKNEPWKLTRQEGTVCRYKDVELNPKFKLFGNGFHGYLDSAEE